MLNVVLLCSNSSKFTVEWTKCCRTYFFCYFLFVFMRLVPVPVTGRWQQPKEIHFYFAILNGRTV